MGGYSPPSPPKSATAVSYHKCTFSGIYTDVKCHPDNEPAPVLSGCVNHTTVEGEMITFKCSFGDNFPPQFLDWELVLENGNSIIIGDHNDYTGFCMHTHQDCPLNNYSCCRFTSELSVHTNLLLNNATVSCNALVNNLTSFGVCHLSELHDELDTDYISYMYMHSTLISLVQEKILKLVIATFYSSDFT